MNNKMLIKSFAFTVVVFCAACNNSDGTSTPKGDPVIVHGANPEGSSSSSGSTGGTTGSGGSASSPSSASGTGNVKNSGVAASQDNTVSMSPAAKDSSKAKAGKKP